MRSLDKCVRYEVRMPDGSWAPAHLEQLDIGDVVRTISPGSKDHNTYPDDKTGQQTPYLTMITQAGYRVAYGDRSEEFLRMLRERAQSIPGLPGPFDVDKPKAPSAKTRKPRKQAKAS